MSKNNFLNPLYRFKIFPFQVPFNGRNTTTGNGIGSLVPIQSLSSINSYDILVSSWILIDNKFKRIHFLYIKICPYLIAIMKINLNVED